MSILLLLILITLLKMLDELVKIRKILKPKKVPSCFGSRPNFQTQAENCCDDCPDMNGCFLKSEEE